MQFRFAANGARDPYGFDVIYFPQQADNVNSFALYDRWADAYSADTESVTHQIARGLCVSAYLAAQVGNTGSSWRSVDQTATIEFPNGSPTLGTPAVVRLNATVNGAPLDLSAAQIVLELQGHEPTFGTFASSTAGEFWLEAEALLPDGRRVFAATPESAPVRIYDPHGGDEDDSIDQNNTVALHHFNGTLNDSTAHHYDLTASGSAAFIANPFADNTTWMKPPGSGKVVCFKGIDDSLDATIPDSWILPASGATLTIEFEIYPRAYLGTANIFALIEKDSLAGEFDQDARWTVSYTWGASAPEVNGAYWWQDNPPISPTILDGPGWSEHVPLNTWHAIKITLNSNGRSTLYVDGSEVGHLDRQPNYGRTGDWLLSLGHFDGDIDELRISKGIR